jgi:uncharacterized glyoxalase superfamily protein PhnB
VDEAPVRPHLLTSTPRDISRTFPVKTEEVAVERVVGIGRVSLKARDPKALAAWHHNHLGVAVEAGPTHGVLISSGAGEMTVWSIFPADTAYFGPGPATSMVNYRVKDLDAVLAQLRAAGAQVEDKVEPTITAASAGRPTGGQPVRAVGPEVVGSALPTVR